MTDLPRLGIRFEGHEPVQDMIDCAREAERRGASSVWVTQHLGRRDAVVVAALIAIATSRVKIGIQNLTPFINNPLLTAMQLSTLAEAAPGRVVASFGIGNALDLKSAGIAIVEGERTLAQAIVAIRTLLAGEACRDVVGSTHFNGARLIAPREVEIMLSVLHPGLAALANSVSVGIQLSAGLSASMAEKCSRAGSGAEVLAFAYFATRTAGSRQALRRKLAYLFRNALLATNITEAGLAIDQAGIIEQIGKGDLDGAARMVPDSALEVFSVCGEPRTQIETLRALARANVGEVVIDLGAGSDDREAALNLIMQAQP